MHARVTVAAKREPAASACSPRGVRAWRIGRWWRDCTPKYREFCVGTLDAEDSVQGLTAIAGRLAASDQTQEIAMTGTTNLESKAGVTGLTLARITLGVVMTVHGFQKLTGFDAWQSHVTSMGLPLPEVSARLAVAGELLGGLGLIVGLLTPVAAFGVLCTMLVAIFKVHLTHGFLARDGGFEFPLMLAMSALFYMLRGAGPVSLDALIAAKRSLKPYARARSDHDRPSTLTPAFRG
jgi:putative oxidoreductase